MRSYSAGLKKLGLDEELITEYLLVLYRHLLRSQVIIAWVCLVKKLPNVLLISEIAGRGCYIRDPLRLVAISKQGLHDVFEVALRALQDGSVRILELLRD